MLLCSCIIELLCLYWHVFQKCGLHNSKILRCCDLRAHLETPFIMGRRECCMQYMYIPIMVSIYTDYVEELAI